MKIAFVVAADIPDGGAVAHRVLMLSRGLVSRGHEVHILAPFRFSPGPLTGEIEGVMVHWGEFITNEAANCLMGTLKKRYWLIRNCRKLLAQGLDWLILYDMGLEGLPFLLLARKHGTLVASENCDIFYLTSKSSLKARFRDFSKKIGNLLISPRVNLNFAISFHIRDYLQGIAPHVPRLIVRAPVDLEKFRVRAREAAAFRSRWGLQDSLVLGYCGGAWAVKGLELLLTALKQIQAPPQSFKLLITGRSADNAQILRRIEELGLTDRVVLTGHLPHKDLLTAMSAADILVEPKIDHAENLAAFPQKIVEYLAMGKPIVAAAVGDLPLYLHDQENSLLCRAGDPDSLAKTLERLMADAALRKKLAVNARKTAVQYFDCRKIAKRIEEAFLAIKINRRVIQ